MNRLFKEFMIGRTLCHVLFESEVLTLFKECQSWYKIKTYRSLKGLTLKMFTGFIKKRGIIVTPARGR
ncbi:hypothetical protein LCGC14_1786490 [marine sediment metagenome]|uniref:Uncharacterized protein n=1 Tax=marine sediment metagenome TaxID=412755 RepID=A0A0F9JTH9_9ZZZZ